MMRRSKIKVRPAIKQVKPLKGKAPLSESESSDVLKSNEAGVELSRPAYERPAKECPKPETLPDVRQDASCEKIVALPTVNSAPVLDKDGNKISGNGTKVPISRRRKLVACPTMAKKRQKTASSAPDSKKTAESRPDVNLVASEILAAVVKPTDSTYSSCQPEATDPYTSSQRVSNEELTSLTSVTTLFLGAESEIAENSVVQAEPSKHLATEMNVASYSSDADSGINIDTIVQVEAVPTNNTSEMVRSIETDISPVDVTNLADEDNRLFSNVPNCEHGVLHVAIKEDAAPASIASRDFKVLGNSSSKNPVTKKCSAVDKRRNSAIAKLKKMKKDQEDNSKWPDLDQNVVSMSDLIFLNPPNKVGLKLGMNREREATKTTIKSMPEPEILQPEIPAVEKAADVPLPVPQIRIAEDGSVVVDEESLVLDTQKPPDPKVRTVYEFGRESVVNQCSFLRRPHPRPTRWSQLETEKFYHCLRIVGAEFTLMGAMIRARTPDDLRRKFRRERKTNPTRVDNALMQQHLSKWTDEMFEPKDESHSINNVLTSSKPE